MSVVLIIKRICYIIFRNNVGDNLEFEWGERHFDNGRPFGQSARIKTCKVFPYGSTSPRRFATVDHKGTMQRFLEENP